MDSRVFLLPNYYWYDRVAYEIKGTPPSVKWCIPEIYQNPNVTKNYIRGNTLSSRHSVHHRKRKRLYII